MKKTWRPHNVGYIVVYVLVLLCTADALYTFVSTQLGRVNEYMSSFSLFTYLIAVVAILYARVFISSRIEIIDQGMHFNWPAYIRPAQGEKRALFIYRQGDLDLHTVDQRFRFDDLARYGYTEDLGFSKVDKFSANSKSKFMPVREVAFQMRDGSRTNLNIGCYNEKQIREVLGEIHRRSGLAPTGKLADMVPDLRTDPERLESVPQAPAQDTSPADDT